VSYNTTLLDTSEYLFCLLMQVQQKTIINSNKDKNKNKEKDNNNNNNNNPLFDRKVDLITAGLAAGYAKSLNEKHRNSFS
jgi:hypothetical protein